MDGDQVQENNDESRFSVFFTPPQLKRIARYDAGLIDGFCQEDAC